MSAAVLLNSRPTRRIRITLSYDGTDFHGWQIQPDVVSIQSTVEAIVGEIEGHPVPVAGSGRTDAGVHALGQVAAFTLKNPIPVDNLQRAMNRLLPPTIRVLSAAEMHADFHPRFDAVSKLYRYRMFRSPICSPFDWRFAHHHPYPLNEEAMIVAARHFEGEHDFTAFAAADEKDAGKSKVRTIFHSRLERTDLIDGREFLEYTVRGSGFLKHMVRNIAGTLIEVGRGNLDGASGIPGVRGPTAPAKGLTLMEVEYKS